MEGELLNPEGQPVIYMEMLGGAGFAEQEGGQGWSPGFGVEGCRCDKHLTSGSTPAGEDSVLGDPQSWSLQPPR